VSNTTNSVSNVLFVGYPTTADDRDTRKNWLKCRYMAYTSK